MENAVGYKLKDTGSLTNWMMAGGSTGEPVVGEGATEFMWTDRYAYTVTEVSPDGKSCVIVADIATRTDNNGMSDAQEYAYAHDLQGKKEKLVFKWGAWRRDASQGSVKRFPKISIKFGMRNAYHDYSF